MIYYVCEYTRPRILTRVPVRRVALLVPCGGDLLPRVFVWVS